MPKKYGTGLYGNGNYSALTSYTTAADQGSFAFSGKAAQLLLIGTTAAARGSFTFTGFPAAINAMSWSVTTGYFSFAGKPVQLTQSNLWTPEAPGSASWTPQPPASDPWNPVIAGSTTWTPQPTSE